MVASLSVQEEVLYPHFCIDVLKIKRALITMYVHATTRTPSWCYIVSYKYVPFERIPIGSDHDVTPLVSCVSMMTCWCFTPSGMGWWLIVYYYVYSIVLENKPKNIFSFSVQLKWWYYLDNDGYTWGLQLKPWKKNAYSGLLYFFSCMIHSLFPLDK